MLRFVHLELISRDPRLILHLEYQAFLAGLPRVLISQNGASALASATQPAQSRRGEKLYIPICENLTNWGEKFVFKSPLWDNYCK